MESYANHPESVSERRALQKEDPSLWSARDVLINMLRCIDNGEFPNLDLLVIAYHYTPPEIAEDSDGRVAYKQMGNSKLASIGLLASAQSLMMGVESDG